jgi:hypothetical protein
VVVGLVALVIGAVAAFAAAVKFSMDLRLGRSGDSAQQDVSTPSAAPTFSSSDYRQSRFPPLTRRRPLVGVNYTHHIFRACELTGTGLLRTYSNPGVARTVHAQLLAMRRAGIATIRTIIWHATDATHDSWGAVSSEGGRLHEPHRTNLIRFLTELKRFGFARVTVSLGPQRENNPVLPTYDSSKFGENWRFIRTIRHILKRYGPRDTRIDLLNEGAPSRAPTEFTPVPSQTGRYLRALYRLYVQRYGNRDVSVSAIPFDRAHRVETLVRILKSTHQPMPRWYDVHIGYDRSQASFSLRDTDAVLNRYGLRQPLVIGEAAYENQGIASAISRFTRESSRRIEEITPWPVFMMRGCPVSPPYAPGPYERAVASG